MLLTGLCQCPGFPGCNQRLKCKSTWNEGIRHFHRPPRHSSSRLECTRRTAAAGRQGCLHPHMEGTCGHPLQKHSARAQCLASQHLVCTVHLFRYRGMYPKEPLIYLLCPGIASRRLKRQLVFLANRPHSFSNPVVSHPHKRLTCNRSKAALSAKSACDLRCFDFLITIPSPPRAPGEEDGPNGRTNHLHAENSDHAAEEM